MSFIDDAVRLNWIPRLNAVAGRPTVGFQDWIKAGSYQIESHGAPDKLELSVADGADTLRFLAFDINRFALAAFETVSSISTVDGYPRSIAWSIVKLYYA